MIVRRKGGLTEFIPSPREKREGLIREGHHDFVFSYHGKPIAGSAGVKRSFRTACIKAGLKYGKDVDGGIIQHDFRRSVKTNMVAAGVMKEYRDTILGQSLKGMDRHYIVPSKEDL